MKIAKGILTGIGCLIVLSACSQGEQKTESGGTSVTTGAENGTSGGQSAGEVYEGTISGVISDSMCGRNHTGMGDLGKDPANCTKQCVERGAKYVLVDEKSGDIYNLSDQSKAADFAGKTVSIAGHIDPAEKAIHVHSLKAE